MKKKSLRNFSLVGLLLSSASAITAAILPANKTEGNSVYINGSVTYSTYNINGSCTVTDEITFGCYNTSSKGMFRLSGTSMVGLSMSNWTTLMD